MKTKYLIFAILIIICSVFVMRCSKDIRLFRPSYKTETGLAFFKPGDIEDELHIEFRRGYGYPFTYPEIHARSKIKHELLHIKEVSFIRHGHKWVLLKNIKRKITYMNNKTDGMYYSINGSKMMRIVDVETPFMDMKIGDTSNIIITQTYTFDDEPLRTQTVPYEVRRYEKRGLEIPWFIVYFIP